MPQPTLRASGTFWEEQWLGYEDCVWPFLSQRLPTEM